MRLPWNLGIIPKTYLLADGHGFLVVILTNTAPGIHDVVCPSDCGAEDCKWRFRAIAIPLWCVYLL